MRLAVSDAEAEPGLLPSGFAIVLDPDAKPVRSGGWFGGSPGRVLRLTAGGREAWDELRAGPVRSRRSGLLARRLTDAGIAHPVPPPLPGPPDVTVVIPVRDRGIELDRCLTSLARAYPVIVIDDASADERAIRRVVTAHAARVIRLDVNVGPAQARNIGTAAADTELIGYVDSDTVPGHGWINDLAAHFFDPALAAVAPRIVPMAAKTSAGSYTGARCNLDLGSRPARVVPYGRVSYLPTAALLVRRKALDEVAGPGGPFDAAMSIGEDVDLIWRLHNAGWRIRYDPSHQVRHEEPSTWRGLLRRRRIYGTSTPMLAVRHPDAMAPLVLYPWPTACVAALVARRPVPALLALAGTGIRLRTALRRTGMSDAHLSPTALGGAAVQSVAQTWLGVGRYLIQFAPGLLAAGVLHRRTRLPAAALALAPPLTDWAGRGRPIGPARFVAGYLADEIAYGLGVITQSMRERTLTPLRPVMVQRSS